ncbi:MAG: metallophosphoesterase family protein [Vicinamibacteraceae bacterium]|nr:metallophosphoesterase family protein [Vicinamibacteraceae bacterium]
MSRARSPAVSPSRRRLLRGLLAAAVGGVTGGAAYGAGYERHRIGVVEYTVPVPGLPSALHGVRAAVLTDLHRSAMVPKADVERAVDIALGARADVVFLLGDYVTYGDARYLDDVADSLARLEAPGGVFAVLGNHDDDRGTFASLRRRRIEVLRDARTRIALRGEEVDLVGIRFWTRRVEDIARVAGRRERFSLLLAHDPRRWSAAIELGLPLLLSGHTHGGQVVLPGLGAIAARKYPVPEGLGLDPRSTLFVSPGVGTIYVPVRINCPPEVSVLTLAPAAIDAP